MTKLTLGSLFSGSGGFELGGLLNGIEPKWASEIEPYPIRVTTKRLPNMKHYGDISTLNGAELEPVDIITFGSPCQDMSIAGKRSGLDGSRSSLFYEAVRIVKEMRCATNGKYPRFIVWENVCGAFSSNNGEDFRAVLKEICSVKAEVSIPRSNKWTGAGEIVADGFSVAWRTLDARYWGVPQRRRRIFLVADFDNRCAGKILFESESVSGYFKTCQCSWKETADIAENSTGEASTLCLNDQGGQRMDVTENMTCTLRAESHHPPLVFENHSADTRYKGPLDLSPTLTSSLGTGGNNQPFVLEECYDVRFTSENTQNSRANVYRTDTARTIDTGGNTPASNQGGIAVVAVQGSVIGRKNENGPQGSGVSKDVSFTLNTVDRHAVAYGIDRAAFNQGKNAQFNFTVAEEQQPTIVTRGAGAVAQPTYCTSKNSHHTIAEKELANTLVATDYKDPPMINDLNSDAEYIVRRLTPVECARLQGFPDFWCDDLGIAEPTETDIEMWTEIFETHRKATGASTKPKSRNQIIKWLKNPHSDSAAYKMWGNGVALPCVCFVLAGIVYCTQNC